MKPTKGKPNTPAIHDLTRSDRWHIVLALVGWESQLEDKTLAAEMRSRAERVAHALDIDLEDAREQWRMVLN